MFKGGEAKLTELEKKKSREGVNAWSQKRPQGLEIAAIRPKVARPRRHYIARRDTDNECFVGSRVPDPPDVGRKKGQAVPHRIAGDLLEITSSIGGRPFQGGESCGEEKRVQQNRVLPEGVSTPEVPVEVVAFQPPGSKDGTSVFTTL